jgi:signal transduction histidine kinase
VHNQTFVQSIRRSLSTLLDPTASIVSASPVSVSPALGLLPRTLAQQNIENYAMAMATDVVALPPAPLAAAIGPDPVELQATMLRLSRKIRLGDDEPEMMATVIQELVKLFSLTGCQLNLYNAESQTVTRQYQYFPGTDIDPDDRIVEVDFPQQVELRALSYPIQFCPWIPPEDQALTVLVYALRDSMGLLGEITLQRRQPDHFTVQDIEAIELLLDPCIHALRRLRLLQASQTQAVELKRLNQVQDNFLGTISYELRVPLSNIRMAIQMITLALTKESSATQLTLTVEVTEKVLRYLDVLQRECDRETKLIQDLLDLQQLDTDTLSLVMASVSVQDWLPYVMTPLQKRALESDVTLDCVINPDLPPLMCDQISLSRIVTELVTNACKFTPARERVLVQVEQNAAGDRAIFKVTNSGIEIPLEERSRIFDKFYRLPKLDIRQQGGTGLGLALVQKLVTRLAGSIDLESNRSGTCFTVELPIQGV